MAKALKSIKFPGIAETYTVPVVDNTLSVEGAAADAYAVGQALESAAASGGQILFDGSCTANTPVTLKLIEGDSVEIIYHVPAYGSDVDVTIKANGVAPTRSRYTYSSTNNTWETGLIARTGSARVATFRGTLDFFHGTLELNGQGNRGSDNQIGFASALWTDLTSVSNITFSIGGYLRIKKI